MAIDHWPGFFPACLYGVDGLELFQAVFWVSGVEGLQVSNCGARAGLPSF